MRNTRKTVAVSSGHRKRCGVFRLSWWRASAPFALVREHSRVGLLFRDGQHFYGCATGYTRVGQFRESSGCQKFRTGEWQRSENEAGLLDGDSLEVSGIVDRILVAVGGAAVRGYLEQIGARRGRYEDRGRRGANVTRDSLPNVTRAGVRRIAVCINGHGVSMTVLGIQHDVVEIALGIECFILNLNAIGSRCQIHDGAGRYGGSVIKDIRQVDGRELVV